MMTASHNPLRLPLALLGLAVAAFPACAQLTDSHPDNVQIATTFALTRVSNVPASAATTGTTAVPTTSVTSPGFGLGLTVNLHRFSLMTLGLDFRLAYVPFTYITDNNAASTDAGRTNLEFVGVRVAFHPRSTRFEPYIEALGGSLSAHTAGTAAGAAGSVVTTTRDYFGYAGGVDYPISRHVSARLAEIGGASRTPPTAAQGSAVPPKSDCLTLNSGLVFRF